MRRWGALLAAVVAIAAVTFLLTREGPTPHSAPAPVAMTPPVVSAPSPMAKEVAVDAGDEDDADTVTLRLAGIVVDRGQPVEGATVSTPDGQDEEEVTAVTDAAGHFELSTRVLRGNEDELAVQLEARKDDRFGAIGFRTAFDKLDLKIELEATATLRVTLREPDGVPIHGGSVDAVGDIGDASPGDGPPQVDFSATTGDHGDAVLHVRPDTYWITASWSGGETVQRTGVLVALGHETHVTLTFRRYSLKGHVLNRDREGVVDAQLELRQHGAKVKAEDDDELSGTDGVFSYVGLAPGTYELSASHASEGSGRATVHVPDLDAKLIVESANDISGRVEDEKGAPQPDFSVSAVSGHTEVSSRASDEGTFRLSCPPGTWVVTATADGFGGDDRQGNVEVKLAAHGHERVTVVVPAAKPIAGQVVDAEGKPQAKVVVTATPAGARRSRVEAFSGRDGRFSFAALSRDEYTLEASGRDVANVEKVVAHPGDTQVRLVIERPARVEGRVVDAAGAPLKHFFVNGEGFDAADGRFSVAPWAEARMPLYLDADALGEAVYAVATKKHGVTEVGDLAVSTLRMRLTVLDARRRPLPQTSFHFQLDGASSGLFMGDTHQHYFIKTAGDDGQLSYPMFFSDGFSVSAFTRTSGKIDRVIVPKATELELLGDPAWLK